MIRGLRVVLTGVKLFGILPLDWKQERRVLAFPF